MALFFKINLYYCCDNQVSYSRSDKCFALILDLTDVLLLCVVKSMLIS